MTVSADAGRQHFADQLKSIRYVRALHSILNPPMQCSLAFPVCCAVRAGDVQLIVLSLERAIVPSRLATHSPECFACAVDVLYAYLTCGNYDFNVRLDDSNTTLPLPSLPVLTLCPLCLRSTTAPRTCARASASNRVGCALTTD